MDLAADVFAHRRLDDMCAGSAIELDQQCSVAEITESEPQREQGQHVAKLLILRMVSLNRLITQRSSSLRRARSERRPSSSESGPR